MTYGQLPNLVHSSEKQMPDGSRIIIWHDSPLLWCPFCLAEASADKADYFLADPNAEILCCEEPMRLVRRRTVYEAV